MGGNRHFALKCNDCGAQLGGLRSFVSDEERHLGFRTEADAQALGWTRTPKPGARARDRIDRCPSCSREHVAAAVARAEAEHAAGADQVYIATADHATYGLLLEAARARRPWLLIVAAWPAAMRGPKVKGPVIACAIERIPAWVGGRRV